MTYPDYGHDKGINGMSGEKNPKASEPNQPSMVRSSMAQYLTFVAAACNSDASVKIKYEDESCWLAQMMMATLYDVSPPAINQHFTESDSILKNDFITIQPEKIREICFSERKFYQKATKIYATSLAYDFFAVVKAIKMFSADYYNSN
jgi:hypothetical protein